MLAENGNTSFPPDSRTLPGGPGPILALTTMNRFTIHGDWNVIKGKLRQKYGQLTDQDLEYEKGREDELLGRLQKKTGAAADELERLINART